MDKRKDDLSKITKESYREKIVEMIGRIEDETMLKKIYTFAKTIKDILNEKEGG